MSDKMFCRVHHTKTDNTLRYLRLKLAYVFNTWLEEMKDLKFVSVAFKRFPLRSSVSAVVIVWLPLFCQRICGLRRNPEQSLAAVLYIRKAQLNKKQKTNRKPKAVPCISCFQYILGFLKFHTFQTSFFFFSDHMTSESTRFWLLWHCGKRSWRKTQELHLQHVTRSHQCVT